MSRMQKKPRNEPGPHKEKIVISLLRSLVLFFGYFSQCLEEDEWHTKLSKSLVRKHTAMCKYEKNDDSLGSHPPSILARKHRFFDNVFNELCELVFGCEQVTLTEGILVFDFKLFIGGCVQKGEGLITLSSCQPLARFMTRCSDY